MLTSQPVLERVRDDRPAYRPYAVTVSRVVRMTPHFTRVTITGDLLDTFGTDGFDQRIKIVFPRAGHGLPEFDEQCAREGTWHLKWRALPDAHRPVFRTYTIRAVRQESREVDIDFVTHGDGGPAARWLATAQPGDELVVIGPDALSIHSSVGLDWHPGSARDFLLVGDETAAPAICAIIESLPSGCRARAFIEVPDDRDALPVERNAECITWLGRDDAPHGARIESALRAWVAANPDVIEPARLARPEPLDDIDVDLELLWDSPEDGPGEFYAWLAGEASVIKSLRRFLVSESGVDRKRVAFMGYWRMGKAEAQE